MTTETQGKTDIDNINQDRKQTQPTELVSLKADVLDQTRLRALSTGLRYSYDAKIVSLLLNLKSCGKADLTVKFVSDRLKHLAKHVDLDDGNAVNLFIARKQCLESHKDGLVKAYNHYAQFYGLDYVKPKFRCEKKLPRVPTKEAIMTVISASSKKYATIFKVLMETGVMPLELANVTLKDIDLDKGTLAVRGFKGHSSRAFRHHFYFIASFFFFLLSSYLSLF